MEGKILDKKQKSVWSVGKTLSLFHYVQPSAWTCTVAAKNEQIITSNIMELNKKCSS